MATFLDIGLFQYFNVIFSVLLIFAILFALLHKTNILGKNATINAIVAVAIALMCLLSETVIDLINFVAPWFVLVFIFVILLLLVYQMLGATEKDIFGALKSEKSIQWAVFGVALLILIAGVAHVGSSKWLTYTEPSETAEGVAEGEEYKQNIYDAIRSPKIIGLILIFLIAIFAIAFLAGESS